MTSLKAISPIGIDVAVPWSVCLSVTFVHCAQMAQDIDPISFAYDSPMPFTDLAKIRSTPSPIFPQSDPPPIDLNVGDIRWQIATEWLEIAQWPQWRVYRKPPSFFSFEW